MLWHSGKIKEKFSISWQGFAPKWYRKPRNPSIQQLNSNRINPSFRLARDRKGSSKTRLSNLLERLIDLEPLDGKAHYELGKLLHHPDDFDRVKLLFEISVDLLPDGHVPCSRLHNIFMPEKVFGRREHKGQREPKTLRNY